MVNNNDVINIIELYNKNISANQISKNLHINISSIMRILRKNNINIRTISENVNYYLNKNFNKDTICANDKIDQIIQGNLLGDGNLRISGTRANYNHTDKNIDYLYWLKKEFIESNIESTIYKNISKNGCYFLQTKTYNLFNKYYDLFYKNIRIVPNSIILTPIILRQWFISDGNISQFSGISISKSPYNDNLMDQLKNIISNKCSYHFDKKRNCGKYYIRKKDKEKFYEYIGSCPIECYDYKWKSWVLRK